MSNGFIQSNILWIEPLCLCFTQFSGNSYSYNFDKIRHQPRKNFSILNFFLFGSSLLATEENVELFYYAQWFMKESKVLLFFVGLFTFFF